MTGFVPCAIDPCPLKIHPDLFMCGGHWRMATAAQRNAVRHAIESKGRGKAAHLLAVRAAVEYVQALIDEARQAR